jgi:hypothetical protein
VQEEWKIQMLVLAIWAETSMANLPDRWMGVMSWAFLNRLGFRTHTSMWYALMSIQSALVALYKDGPNPLDQALYAGGVTEAEIRPWVVSEYTRLRDSLTLKIVEMAVRDAYMQWLSYGSGSSADIAGGATDFYVAKPSAFDAALAQFEGNATLYGDDYWYSYEAPINAPYFNPPERWLFTHNLSVVR